MLANALGQAAGATFAVLVAEVPGRAHFAQLNAAATATMQPWPANLGAFRDDGPAIGLSIREVLGLDWLTAFDAARGQNFDERRVLKFHDYQGTGWNPLRRALVGYSSHRNRRICAHGQHGGNHGRPNG